METINEQLNQNKEIKEGVLVRWKEYPDRLYFVKQMGVNFCGSNNCCKLESIDHKFTAIVPTKELVWDDVDYIGIDN